MMIVFILIRKLVFFLIKYLSFSTFNSFLYTFYVFCLDLYFNEFLEDAFRLFHDFNKVKVE